MTDTTPADTQDAVRSGADGRPWPGMAEAFGVWARIALMSFGGPAGQIAVMHRILVEEKRWLSETRFLHALNFCMLLPGPEAQQLATYIGWLVHRTWGGLLAGVLFILPGAVAILALSYVYVTFGDVTLVEGIFYGLKAAVLAIVLGAVFRIAGKALHGWGPWVLAGASFIAIFGYGIPFPIVVLSAGVVGFAVARTGSGMFAGGGHHGKADAGTADSLLGDTAPEQATLRSVALPAACAAALWALPVVVCMVWLGPGNVFSIIAVFFSKMATVTFGGAYAVLAYVAQAGVETHGWLQPHEMLDGLGMAETTPGPLIMVVQFVGYLAAYRDPGGLDPSTAGLIGAGLTTWVTFAPCFLWIFVGAPYIERLRRNKSLSAALSAITAAVVGVILNLAVWFGLHVLFGSQWQADILGMQISVPDPGTVDPLAAILCVASLLAITRFRVSPVLVLALCAGIGAGAVYAI